MRISELKTECVCLGVINYTQMIDIIKLLGLDINTVSKQYMSEDGSWYEFEQDKRAAKLYLRRFDSDETHGLCVTTKNYGGASYEYDSNLHRIYQLTEIEEYKEHYKPIKGYRLNKYYVMKIGGTAPKHPHDTYKAAMAEAKRLQAMEGAANFVIFKCKGVLATEIVVTEHNG